MLPTKNYVDRPKTKSAIVLTKIGQHTPARLSPKHKPISLQLGANYEIDQEQLSSVLKYPASINTHVCDLCFCLSVCENPLARSLEQVKIIKEFA